MLNFNLAIVLIVIIWVVVIAALLAWFFVARARRNRVAEETVGPRRHSAQTPVSADPLGADVTQPIDPLRRPSAPAPHAAGPEPFGLTTQREYERLAAEPFQAPPAAALDGSRKPERFSWEEASKSGPTLPVHQSPEPVRQELREETPLRHPQPTRASHKATGITNQPLAASEPDLDRTVVVPREAPFGWSLLLPDGDRLALTRNCVLGRRPMPVEGASPVVIADTTRTLSKSHARLRFDGSRWWVTDLDSTNGVWLMHESGLVEEARPQEEIEATPKIRLGTLDVELLWNEDPV